MFLNFYFHLLNQESNSCPPQGCSEYLEWTTWRRPVPVVRDDDDETENAKLIGEDLEQTTWRWPSLVVNDDDETENAKLISKDLKRTTWRRHGLSCTWRWWWDWEHQADQQRSRANNSERARFQDSTFDDFTFTDSTWERWLGWESQADHQRSREAWRKETNRAQELIFKTFNLKLL